jgi:hypothetical protein
VFQGFSILHLGKKGWKIFTQKSLDHQEGQQAVSQGFSILHPDKKGLADIHRREANFSRISGLMSR